MKIFKKRLILTSVVLASMLSHAREGEQKVCNDLYSAACVGADGKNKFREKNNEIRKSALNTIQAARDKTAKNLGYENFDAGLKARLKEAGLALKDPVDIVSWQKLKGETPIELSFDAKAAGKLYVTVAQCENELEALNTTFASSVNEAFSKMTIEDVRLIHTQVKASAAEFADRYEDKLLRLYAIDIPSFVMNAIGDKCRIMRSTPENYAEEDNAKIYEVCRNQESIRHTAGEIYRAEGTSEYRALAEKFVRENTIPDLVYKQKSAPPVGYQSASPEAIELARLRLEIQKSAAPISGTCSRYGQAAGTAAKKITEDYMLEINRNKITVDSVIDGFYTEENRDQVEQIYNSSKADVQSLLTQITSDRDLIAKINKQYDQMKLLWLKKPDTSVYRKDGNGKFIIDDEKTSKITKAFDNPLNYFDDPTLSYFTDMNANYMLPITLGETSQDERVSTMPVYIQIAKDNPYAYMTVVAHEIAHKIGPQISRMSGYDLTPSYGELLACYKGSKSIKLTKGQEDEVVADYISSEVLARQIARLPSYQRVAALKLAMEPFCLFDDSRNMKNAVDLRSEHPDPVFRISGVFGASPNLRAAVGCKGESKLYRSCGIKQIQLLESVETKNKGTDSLVTDEVGE